MSEAADLRTDLKGTRSGAKWFRVRSGVKSVSEVVVGTDDQFGRRTARNASGKQIVPRRRRQLLRQNHHGVSGFRQHGSRRGTLCAG